MHRHCPPLAHLTDDRAAVELDAVQVHRSELVVAGHRRQGMDAHAGPPHVDDEGSEAAVALREVARPREEQAVAGELRPRAPHLLARHRPPVARRYRPCAQGREVGAGIGFAEELAPDLVGARHGREQRGESIGLGVAHEGRGHDVGGDEVDDLGGAGPPELVADDRRGGGAEAAAAERHRPRGHGEAGSVQGPLEGHEVLEPGLQVVVVGLRPDARGKGPDLGPEALQLGRDPASHDGRSTSRPRRRADATTSLQQTMAPSAAGIPQ